MNPTASTGPRRLRIINFFRRLFMFKPVEHFLAFFTIRSKRSSIAWKLAPPEYLYQKVTHHRVNRQGIAFDLDLSNHNDYYLFYGFTEPRLLRLFSTVRPHFIIIDIGANIGFTALTCAKLCTQGFIHAYEPDENNYRKLLKNAELNPYKNLAIFRKGLGDAPSVQNLVTYAHHSGMNRIQNPVTGEQGNPVEIFPLDTEAASLASVNLIKIDVEGYELNVIRGGLQTIRKFKPILFIELNEQNLKQYGHSSETLVNLVIELGYQVFDAKTNELLGRDNWNSMETDILCLPITKGSEE